MNSYKRLPLEQRKKEIQQAALLIFNEKGFSSTTMENIVDKVSLSKGGVYRIYPSTTAILSDIILSGMHMRNSFYEKQVKREIEEGRQITLPFIIEMISDSLLLSPEIASVYVEFLWEKKRNAELAALYEEICEITITETTSLIKQYGAEEIININEDSLKKITELMNATILSLQVLDLKEEYIKNKEEICKAIFQILKF